MVEAEVGAVGLAGLLEAEGGSEAEHPVRMAGMLEVVKVAARTVGSAAHPFSILASVAEGQEEATLEATTKVAEVAWTSRAKLEQSEQSGRAHRNSTLAGGVGGDRRGVVRKV